MNKPCLAPVPKPRPYASAPPTLAPSPCFPALAPSPYPPSYPDCPRDSHAPCVPPTRSLCPTQTCCLDSQCGLRKFTPGATSIVPPAHVRLPTFPPHLFPARSLLIHCVAEIRSDNLTVGMLRAHGCPPPGLRPGSNKAAQPPQAFVHSLDADFCRVIKLG
jgi:hypothetical protein